MALPSILSIFTTFYPGSKLIDGGELLQFAKQLVGVNPDVTALAGGGATGATPVQLGLTRVSVVASGADSIQLPPAIPGARCRIQNAGAQSMQVFGQQANQGGLPAGDQIIVHNSNNAAAVTAGVAHASATDGEYVCYTVGLWKQLLSS